MNRDIATLREVIEKLTPLLAGRGIKVTQRGLQAFVASDRNGKPVSVNLPVLPDNAPDDLILAIQGFLDHEVAHLLFTDFPVQKKALAHGKHIGALWNIIEDLFIEAAMRKRFPGSAFNLEVMHEFFIENLTKPRVAQCAGDPKGMFGVLLVPMCRAWAGQQAFQRYLDASGLLPFMEDALKSVPQPLRDRIAKVGSSEESLVLALELDKALRSAPPKPKPKPKPAPKPEPDPECEPKPSEDEADPESEPEKGDGKGDEGEPSPGESTDPEKEEDEGEGAEGEGDPEKDGAGGDEGEPEGPDEDADPEGEPEPDDEFDPGELELDGDEDAAGESGGDEDEGDEPGADDADDEGEEGSEGGAGDDGSDYDDDDLEPDSEDGSAAGEPDGDDEAARSGGTPTPPEPSEDEDEGDDLAGGEEPEEEEPEAEHAPGYWEKTGMGAGAPSVTFEDGLRDTISASAMEEAKSAEYLVYTKDEDIIEVFKPSTNQMTEMAEVRHPTTGKLTEEKVTFSPAERLDEEVRHMVGVMQKDIERMMAARSQVLKVPGYRSGKLHGASLHRVISGDERVFRRKLENTSKDVVVSLLLDCSGSMGGAKYELAMKSGYALSATLERVGIKHEVLGFTTKGIIGAKGYSMDPAIEAEEKRAGIRFARYERLYMPIFKTFSERLVPEVKNRFAMAPFEMDLANNIDGESVEMAAMRLLQRPEHRRVLIVESDGFPSFATHHYALGHTHLKKVVQQVEAMGVETIGIGIMSEAVKDFYPKHVVLQKVEELPGQVMKELRRILA